jgi:TonB-linked SusC/RagA family outer membrane protein
MKQILTKPLKNNERLMKRRINAFFGIAIFFLLITSTVKAQNTTSSISGRVTDTDGNGIPGVTIIIEGTTDGTLTNIDGYYELSNLKEGITLVYSYIGMQSERIVFTGQQTIDITLAPDSFWLDEFVVVGYGTMKRSDLTGSVVSVTSEDLNRFPAANLTEMLRGQAAGIHVTTADASPGGAASIRIRGNRSLSSSQSPLYIVDGMTVPHINDLNANDIESVEILKDASSQAIYGSRASNGVVLITTKRGKDGEVSVNLDSYVGFQQFTRNFDLYSPEEWVELRFWAKYNDGQSGIGEPDDINYQAVIDDDIMYNAWQNQNFTNWEDLMLGNAVQQKHDISVRGGSERMKYATAFGLLNQDGVVKNSGFTRANFRLNTDFNVASWLDIGSNIALSRSTRETTDGSFNQFITRPPLGQPFNEDGSITREVTGTGDINPLWRIDNYDREINDEYVNFSTFANVTLINGLTYRLGANIRSNNRETGMYQTKDYPGSTGEGSISNWLRTNWLIDNVLTYELPLNPDVHDLTLTMIQSIEEDRQSTTGFDFINSTTDLFGWNVAADSEISSATRNITSTSAMSYAARLHYSLLDKYMITASIRRDGASVFGKENKWGNFPSAAIGWRINEEGFLSNVTWLNLLRLRASYGVVGNWAIPAYRTLGLANSYEYLFGTELEIGYLPGSQLLNPDLKWETTGSFNTGLDFSAFDGRLNANIEYYQTSTKDLLVQRTIPSITGYTLMWDNLGETESNGWEFSLDGWLIDNNNFTLKLGATVSTQNNKIIKIDGRVDEDGNPVDDINNGWFIGESINVIYQYVFDGIWQESEIENVTENDYLPGDAAPTAGSVRLADHNGDGMITIDDRKIFDLDPQWYGSFNINALYKGFDLVMDFYTVQGVQRNNSYLYNYDSGGSLNGKLNGMRVNYWTPENQSQDAPRPQFTAAVPYFGTIGIQDASYIRLRSLTLGYTLPRVITQSLSIDKARLYFTGTNLFTQTQYLSYGPESSPGSYPEAQTFTFGVNLSF